MLGKDRVEVSQPRASRVVIGCIVDVSVVLSTAGRGAGQRGPPACDIKDYGRGVSYSNCASTFGPALADFRQYHEVVSISSFALSDAGTSGYWVITKEKQ